MMMLALSIRQPYAELILRGMKRVEYRSRPTQRIGERFYIYATQKWATPKKGFSDNLEIPESMPWMVELANAMKIFPVDLPTGMIVGTAVIEKVTQGSGATSGYYHWHLKDVQRLTNLIKPKGHPQPVWFDPN